MALQRMSLLTACTVNININDAPKDAAPAEKPEPSVTIDLPVTPVVPSDAAAPAAPAAD